MKQDPSAIQFYKEPNEGKQLLVRISGRERIKVLKDTAGITECGKGIRFYGYFIEEEKTLVIETRHSRRRKTVVTIS